MKETGTGVGEQEQEQAEWCRLGGSHFPNNGKLELIKTRFLLNSTFPLACSPNNNSMQTRDRDPHSLRSHLLSSSSSLTFPSSKPSTPRARPQANLHKKSNSIGPSLSATLAAFSESERELREQQERELQYQLQLQQGMSTSSAAPALRRVSSSEENKQNAMPAAGNDEDGTVPAFRPALRKVVITPRKAPSPPPPSTPMLRKVVVVPKPPPPPQDLNLPDLRPVEQTGPQSPSGTQAGFPGLAALRPVSMRGTAPRPVSTSVQPIASMVKLKSLAHMIKVQEPSETEKQRIREAAERAAKHDAEQDMFRSKMTERASWTPQQFEEELRRKRDEEIARLENERLARLEEEKKRKEEEEKRHRAVEEERRRKRAEEEEKERRRKQQEEDERLRLQREAEEAAQRERERIRLEEEEKERELERERLRLEEEEREKERIRLEEEERERQNMTTSESAGSDNEDDDINSEMAQSHEHGDDFSLSSEEDNEDRKRALALLSQAEQEEERARRIEQRKIRKNARTRRTDEALNATFGPNAEEVYHDAKNKLRGTEYEKIEEEKDTDFEGTSRLFIKLNADRGDMSAQYTIAKCYLNGTGIAVSIDKAKKYLQLAAAQGHLLAKEKLEAL